mmetsp:Transcript_7606/g.8632  ORF Transcript_7606/g.8632 Transcript_7606/m.8632 type:complete len:103 (+) Transcript_7606:157-465(+)
METVLVFARIVSLTKEEASGILKNSAEQPLLEIFNSPINERNEEAAVKYLKEKLTLMKEEKKATVDAFKSKWENKCESKELYQIVLSLHEGEYNCLQLDISV